MSLLYLGLLCVFKKFFCLIFTLVIDIFFQNLVRSALIGIIIGVFTALPILIIATHNVLTGTFATITIILIVTMVMGFIPMVGWKLGVSDLLL